MLMILDFRVRELYYQNCALEQENLFLQIILIILVLFYLLTGSTRLCEVDLNGEYTSDLEYFDFDSDMEPLVVARRVISIL